MVSTDPGGYYGGPAAPAQPEAWAVSAVPNPRVAAYEAPQRAQVPVSRKRNSYERSRMVVGGALLAIVAAIVVVSIMITSSGSKQAEHTATTAIQKAQNTVLKVDLSNAATAEEAALASSGTYATSTRALTAAGFVASPGDVLQVVSASETHFCLSATDKVGNTMYLDSTRDIPSVTPCH